jgi:hypothetical protein
MPALLETKVRSLGAALAHRLDQDVGDAAKAEAAGHDGHAVLDGAGQRGLGVRENLLHRVAFAAGTISPEGSP